MAWIQIEQALPTHRKTLNLADTLDITPTHAVGLMVTLWLWSLDNAPSGDLGDISPRTLARILQWDGDSNELMSAMRNAGFIDGDEIHDWQEYVGRLLDQRAAAKERMRKHRAKSSERSEEIDHDIDTLREPFANDTRTEQEPSTHVHGRVQYTTLHQSKEQDSKEDIAPLPPKGERQQPVPFEKIMQLFNETCTSFPKVLKIDGQRRKAVAARWKTYGDIDIFETLFRKTQSSSFLKGQNDRNWIANFDWIVKPTNMAKILEDRYIDKERDHGSINHQHNGQGDGAFSLSGFHIAGDDKIEEVKTHEDDKQQETPQLSGFHIAGDDE